MAGINDYVRTRLNLALDAADDAEVRLGYVCFNTGKVSLMGDTLSAIDALVMADSLPGRFWFENGVLCGSEDNLSTYSFHIFTTEDLPIDDSNVPMPAA